MDDLIVEDGRVVGARIVRDGTPLNVEARKGVLLAAGGFGHNAEMRRQYSGDQPNDAQVVDRQRRRHRRSAADGDAAGRENRSARRSMVVAFGFHRQRRRRRRVAGLGTAAARRHLRRLDRPAVLQRVELLRRGRQGDVRQQGGAVLDDLRRRICAQIRHERQPVEAQPAPACRADRVWCGQACRQHRRPGPPDRPARRRADPNDPAVQRVCGQGPGSGLRAGAVGLQRLPRRSRISAERRGRPAGAGAVSTRRGCCRRTSGRAGA